MSAVLALCAGFLLAVLWFDLMFDVQALGGGRSGEPLPEEVLAAIAAYYRRVTTHARPMTHLIALVMLVTRCGSGRAWTRRTCRAGLPAPSVATTWRSSRRSPPSR